MNEWAATFIPVGATLIIGIIGYFIKRSVFGRVDECERTIKEIKEKFTPIERHNKDFEECKGDIKQIRQDYTPRDIHMKDFDEVRADIKHIKEDYITKEDFFREQGKTDRKLDKIMDILLEMKGEK